MSIQKDFIIENGILKKYIGKGGNVVIPDGVTEIGEHAFMDSSHVLTGVVIPYGVTVISKGAFAACVNLETVVLPESLVSIGERAFVLCYSIGDIVIPANVTEIDDSSFDFTRPLTIHGISGSCAEQFAQKYYFPFISVYKRGNKSQKVKKSMTENIFDKEKISLVNREDIPNSYVTWNDNRKTYDIREKRERWWQCPKCGGNISFDSCDQDFDESLGENQFFNIYSWSCVECKATGSTYAVVNPLYISVDQDED